MKIKEVVNLRKLYEEFYNTEKDCEECPFDGICRCVRKSEHCLVGQMLGEDSEFKDLYDMEREGTLKKGFELEVIS